MGATRGQGRSHALRLAKEGVKIIGFDLCQQINTVPFAMSGPDDLAETERLVREVGSEMVSTVADVRDREHRGCLAYAKAAIPHLIDQEDGGCVVLTGSGASESGIPNLPGYVASKHAVPGLMRRMAKELGR